MLAFPIVYQYSFSSFAQCFYNDKLLFKHINYLIETLKFFFVFFCNVVWALHVVHAESIPSAPHATHAQCLLARQYGVRNNYDDDVMHLSMSPPSHASYSGELTVEKFYIEN